MLEVVAVVADVFEVIEVQSHVRVEYVARRQIGPMVDYVARRVVASLADPAVDASAVCYEAVAAVLPGR